MPLSFNFNFINCDLFCTFLFIICDSIVLFLLFLFILVVNLLLQFVLANRNMFVLLHTHSSEEHINVNYNRLFGFLSIWSFIVDIASEFYLISIYFIYVTFPLLSCRHIENDPTGIETFVFVHLLTVKLYFTFFNFMTCFISFFNCLMQIVILCWLF